MSVNASSSSNASLPPSPLSSSNNLYSFLHNCFNTTNGVYSIIAFTTTSILILLPLYILVLYVILQRWRQQRSGTTVSHFDVFTFHTVIMELMNILGFSFLCYGVHADIKHMMTVGIYLLITNLIGQMFFHILTCVERYLAVIHPITYLNLKKAKWITIRNVTIGCVWMLSFVWTSTLFMNKHSLFIMPYFCNMAITLTVVCFSSISVLCVLIRPGPGEGGGGRQWVDQLKQKVLHNIVTILGVLVFRFGGNMLITALYATPQLGETGKCGLFLSVNWLCLPSSLVLPLLFLYRAGKLLCCKNNNESG